MMLFHGYAGSKLGLGEHAPLAQPGLRDLLDDDARQPPVVRNRRRRATPAALRATTATSGSWTPATRSATRRSSIALLVDEGLIDPDKIGATGGSYGGGMSMALAALKNRKMLPDGSLVDWESPDGTPLKIAGAAPDIPWTDLSYSLVPNGGNLDYIADAPYLGHVDRVGIEKQAYVNALYSSGLANGFYAPEGEDPDADLTGWKAALDTGGPYGAEVLEIVDEITTHHSSYYIDDSTKPSPLLISSGATDDLFPANEGTRFFNRTLTNHPNADIAFTFADFGHPRGQGLPETERVHHRAQGRVARPLRPRRGRRARAGRRRAHAVVRRAPRPRTTATTSTRSHRARSRTTRPPRRRSIRAATPGDVLFGGQFSLVRELVHDGRRGRQPRGRHLQARRGSRRTATRCSARRP